MNSEQDGFSLLLLAVVLFQLPTPAIVHRVTCHRRRQHSLTGSIAMLVGMLVDQGRMRWDEPVEAYLPKFKLAGQRTESNARHDRDVLSHYTIQPATKSGREK